MPRISAANRTITLKIVYYGPGLSGKTTNLTALHAGLAEHVRGELVRLDTETERTLFFDYFPQNLGLLGSFRVRADFFTVPGQSFYRATRRAVLEGADGIVFVADSTPAREEANLVSLDDMHASLAAQGRKPEDVPTVFQWNKRDVRGALSEAVLARQLNPRRLPAISAVASTGVGVTETQGRILEAVLADLRARARAEPAVGGRSG